jgi:hypothetical protein
MLRAFFQAVGLSLCILGAESLVVERAYFAKTRSPQAESAELIPTAAIATGPREIRFPEWAPFTLLSAGVVVVLYSVTVTKA